MTGDDNTKNKNSGMNTQKEQVTETLGKRFKTNRFSNGLIELSGCVIVDRLTGVNYLFVTRGMQGDSGLTVLVDENGKPLVTNENKLNNAEGK